jgi:hypothetical protein
MHITGYLQKYLNTDLLSSFSRIQTQFDVTADFILKNCVISVDDKVYRITEIEFYYYREGIHEDPFVHKHENQLEMGVWYFHNVGQDLTFGDGRNYGGILIRGILPPGSDPGKIIDGPVRSYEKLFNAKLDLNRKHHFGITISEKPLISPDAKIYKFPRSGMYPKGKKDPEKYMLLPYRYMLYPWYSKVERHVIYLYLKYFKDDDDTAGKLLTDSSMISIYEDAFIRGTEMNSMEADLILSGTLNMNVENKCRLIGYYTKNMKGA